MPISIGIAGYEMTQPQRIAALITAVGGPVKAAALLGKSRTTIDNMRKEGWPPSLDILLPLCQEAGVSLDWVATGYQQRPDLATGSPGLVAIAPLRPGDRIPPLAFDADWLKGQFDATADDLRLALVDDDGMAPLVGKGATALLDIRPAAVRTGLYLLDLDGEWVARRIRKRLGGKLELVADADPAWLYDLSGIEVGLTLHRILWTGRTL
ncbi:helix-turn-helix transcriptional regulator [Devosia sp.]|jgi:transcriptional regulator with XRE-family HTH domain|uniref:helix-turn-helix transcriptional regulator n=1 Tax=Devosia sp. TaxID=1871048 RepID=UPI0037BEEB74